MRVKVAFQGGPLDGETTIVPVDAGRTRRSPIPYALIPVAELAVHAAHEALGEPLPVAPLGEYRWLSASFPLDGIPFETFVWHHSSSEVPARRR